MKKLLILLVAALALISCKKDPEWVKEMPEVYMTGYTLYKIPYENKYYKVTIAGDYHGYGEQWGRELIYSPKLTKSDLPYSYNLVNKILLEDITEFTQYNIYVHYSSSNSGDGTQCLRAKIDNSGASDIASRRQGEYRLKSTDGKTEIGIKFSYK